MSLYAKRLERGRFIWPSPADGTVAISAAQLAYMLDGIDWRNPRPYVPAADAPDNLRPMLSLWLTKPAAGICDSMAGMATAAKTCRKTSTRCGRR